MAALAEGTIALLTMVEVGEMTEDGRRVIALWLHRQAELLIEEGHGYNARHWARFTGSREEIASLEDAPLQTRNVLVYQP